MFTCPRTPRHQDLYVFAGPVTVGSRMHLFHCALVLLGSRIHAFSFPGAPEEKHT